MSQKLTIILSLLLICLTAIACDKTTEIAGIDRSTELSALTDEQNDSFCGHLQGTFTAVQEDESIKKAGCMLGGVMSSMFSGEEDEAGRANVCQAKFDECMAEELDEQEDAGGEICPDAEARAECSATIAEVDICINGMLDWGFDSLKSIGSETCADLVTEEGTAKVEAAMENLQSLGEGLPEIEACTALREKCPDFS